MKTGPRLPRADPSYRFLAPFALRAAGPVARRAEAAGAGFGFFAAFAGAGFFSAVPAGTALSAGAGRGGVEAFAGTPFLGAATLGAAFFGPAAILDAASCRPLGTRRASG